MSGDLEFILTMVQRHKNSHAILGCTSQLPKLFPLCLSNLHRRRAAKVLGWYNAEVDKACGMFQTLKVTIIHFLICDTFFYS